MINRLTELLEGVLDPDLMGETITQIAEHLVENGVIVLPCKAGDKVYCIWQYSNFVKEESPFIEEAKAETFIFDEGKAKVIPENYGDMVDRFYRLLDVAFTREEAEKALAERSENGTR